MTEIGTLLQNRYLIKEKIGTGGMGAVYLGIDKRFDNCVAIKETFYKQDEFGDAFEREARLLNGLQHPVLPHVSDYFAEKGSYFLVMQYIEGEDLSDILKREGAFPIEDVLRWTDSLLDALDYLHSQNPPVIHRDIKPHNLKLTPRGDIMLLDFGLAKINQKDVTEVSVFGYSRTYSPLEQIQGTGTDARSDIFALGATAYHLITGKPPINALTRAAGIVNNEKDPLPFANELRPEISGSIASVINTALALNPQNRFISAEAMRQALEFAVGETSNAKAAKNVSATAVVGASSPRVVAHNQNFPALESFAAAKTALDDEQPSAAEKLSETPIIEDEKPDSADSSYSPIIVDIAANDSSRMENTRNRFIWAAGAVLLLFGIAAAFYFGNRSNSAEQNNQSPIVENTPSGQKSRETTSKTSLAEKTSEKTEAEKTEAEKTKAEAEKPLHSASKQAKKQTTAEDETVLDDEEQPEDSSNIETDNPEPKNETRPRPTVREIPDVMTDEQLKELKREEKQKRRQRRNQPNPDQDQP
jgi:serine/threonine protein kinase